jgi:hypothetical protein
MSKIDQIPQSAAVGDGWAGWESRHATLLWRATAVLITFGAFWRVARYLMAMPIWGDEAMLLVNYQTRDYADVFGPIEYCQIAPLLFHWVEMAVLHLLGPSEWSMRLPSLIASLTGLGLFCILARMTLTPLPRMIAVGILSVAIWPATTGSLAKPYAWDLLFGVALLLPCASWRRRPESRWPFVALCTLAPIALTGSYPSVFVAGAVGLAMTPATVQRGDRRQLALLVLYHLLVACTFLLHYEFVGKPHLNSVTYGVSTADGMANFWGKAFPPGDPLRLLVWLPSTFAGEIFAYPIGSQRGGSVVTFVLCVIGAVALRRQRDLLMVIFLMLALWFLAAVLHKYPIGSCRLGQHAAAGFCLLAGAGSAALLRRCVNTSRARCGVIAVVVLLLLVGIGGFTRDLVHPYRDREARDSRNAVRDLFKCADAPILVAQSRSEVRSATVQYYLGAKCNRVHWLDSPEWTETTQEHHIVWVVVCSMPPETDEETVLRQRLSTSGSNWKCVDRKWADVTGKGPPATPTFRAYRFVRQ